MSSTENYLEDVCPDYPLPWPAFSWIPFFFRSEIQEMIASFYILNDSSFMIIYNIWRYKNSRVEEVVKQVKF
jgi:hypothetical protein